MDGLVELGRTGGAYGFRGWVRIVPFETGEVLEKVRNWTLVDQLGRRTEVVVKGLRRHGTGFIAKWDGCDTKEAADALRLHIAVSRADFPDAGEDAVWAVDLVGCEVVNLEGAALGTLVDIGTNGAQDLLIVEYTAEDGKKKRFMVPNVKDVFLREIDIEKKRIAIDWLPEWR